MQFIKKHYEKIILGIVLAGLIGGLVFMFFYILSDKQAMMDQANSIINRPVKALPDLDLTTNNAAISRFAKPFSLDLEAGNKVFNPFEWQKTPDGRMVKKASSVAQVVTVTGITPLYFNLSLESVTTNEFGARYTVVIERQADPSPAKRPKQRRYVSVGDKANDAFGLLEVKGAPEDPSALVLKLVDNGESVSISRSKSYQRVDGYMADLISELDKRPIRAHRVGDPVYVGGVSYKIFDINKNEVILEDQSNHKKTPLPFSS